MKCIKFMIAPFTYVIRNVCRSIARIQVAVYVRGQGCA
jgi:hypothetical protein